MNIDVIHRIAVITNNKEKALAFYVNDIEGCRKELLSKNVRCDDYRIDSTNGQKLFFCYDPFGLPIEIHE